MAQAKGDNGKRRRLTAADRRTQLLAAAREVFLDSGMKGARTRRIADVAGVNESLLYQHFSSKEEIFDEAVVKPLSDIVSTVTGVGQNLPPFDPDARVQRQLTQQYIAELLRVFLDVTPLLGVVLFSDRDTGQGFYAESVAPLATGISDVVRDSFPTWSHREFDPRLVTMTVLGACASLSLERHFLGTEIDVDATAAQLTDLFFDGLVAPSEGSKQVHGPKRAAGRRNK